MNVKCFQIKCLTNLHVGNGDVNFNIIDNEVERDPVTGFPTINASGVKGALRAYWNTNKLEHEEDYFGKPSGSESLASGKLKFFTANMLAIPMRASEGDKVYYLVTNPTALELYKSLCESLGTRTADKCIKEENNQECFAEGYSCSEKYTFNGAEIMCMENSDFQSVRLPVMARNYLENGISKNLWYEEIVPHESIFYFFVGAEDKKLLSCFTREITGNDNEGKVIQFGGNAGVGCGYCLVTEVKGANENE